MIHGNLRTSKILLVQDSETKKLRAKLADAGFERILRHTERRASVVPSTPSNGLELTSMSSLKNRRTHVVDERSIRYFSPELCEHYLRDRSLESKVTFESEIYAFSIVMWETLTSMRSWSDLSSFDIAARVSQGDRPPHRDILKRKDDAVNKSLILYMRACWSQSPSLRPAITKESRKRIRRPGKSDGGGHTLYELAIGDGVHEI